MFFVFSFSFRIINFHLFHVLKYFDATPELLFSLVLVLILRGANFRGYFFCVLTSFQGYKTLRWADLEHFSLVGFYFRD